MISRGKQDDKPVEDAVKLMLPEKLLLSERDDRPNFVPGNEYVQGLYFASKEPKKKAPVRFSSKEEALKAYRQGLIGVDDPIVIE